MMLTNEEKDALRFEFSRLIRQKHHIGAGNQAFKWQAKHEHHLSGVVKMIVEYERQTGDYHSFLGLGEHQASRAVKETARPAQMPLL